jgi:DNA repair exonuclease SbcCD ATPase subunit
MSDSILVRVTLDSYDLVHPSEKQTQVYVQIPEVARASWLLDADFYAVLKNEPWPHVIDSAHAEYERRGVVSDSTSEAARKAIVDWLLLSEGADYDARFDAVQAAWEADQARQHPVARKLLARVAELEAAAYGDATVRLLNPIEQIRHLHSCVAAQMARANTLDRLCREQRSRVAELEEQVRLLNTQRGDVAQLIERERGEGEECVDIDNLVAALALGSDEVPVAGRDEWCTGCNVDHNPSECGYRPETGGA